MLLLITIVLAICIAAFLINHADAVTNTAIDFLTPLFDHPRFKAFYPYLVSLIIGTVVSLLAVHWTK